MQCKINWSGTGMAFNALTESGHSIALDGAQAHGGKNLGFRPMELLLTAAASCSAFDVLLILQRGRHQVTGLIVAADGERALTDPKVFEKIHLHFEVEGIHIPEVAIERAIQLSQEKYCSVSIMLAKTAMIQTSFHYREAVSS